MTAADLPIEALRQRLAQMPLQGQGAAGLETVYREMIGFVPPCAVAPGAAKLASRLHGLHERMRLRDVMPGAIPATTAHLLLLAMLLTSRALRRSSKASRPVAPAPAGTSCVAWCAWCSCCTVCPVPIVATSSWRLSPNASVRTGSPVPWRRTVDPMGRPVRELKPFRRSRR